MPKLSQSTTTSSTSWSCEVCTLKNPVRRRRCQACESRRPVVVEEQQQQQPDPAPNCINGVGGGGGTEESGSSIASPPSPPGVSASSCAIAAAATSTTAVTESESSDKDPPNTPLVSDWLQRRRRQQRKRTRTSSSLCCSGHNRLLHVTLCVNYGNDAFEALVASIPHSAQPLQSPAEVVLAHESVVVVVAKSITTTSPTHHPHDNDTLSSVPTIDASAVAVAAPVAVTSTATTQTTTSPSSSTTQDHETNILSIAPRMEVVASVAVAKKNVPASTSTPPRLWIAGKSPRDMPPSENPATALGNTEVNLRCDQVSSQSHESGVSIDSCGGAEANNVYHPKPHVTIRSDVRSCTILGCDDKNAVEAPEDRPGPRCDDGAARDMEVESSSQGGSDAAGQVATTTEPGPQSTLPQHISNALMSPLPENETSETDQTQTQRMESASPCRGDIPVPSGTLEFSAPLQDDPGGTPTLLNPHGPVSQTKGTLASEDLFSFAYTQVSSQELESSQENLSQEKNSSRSPNDRTFLPLPSSAKPNSKPPFDLLGDAEQEMACSNNNRNACHTSQIQCCVSGTSPPSTQLNNPAVHSLSHGAEPESSLSVHDPPSITATSSASHPPMFTTAGHRRPICVSESDLNRANHFWDSLESNHHSAGVPPHDQIIRRVGQNRWQRRLGYPVQPSAISAHPRSLGKRSMDVVKSTPTLFRPSSHCKPKDSIPFSGKSNLTATGFQTAGLGETLLVPEGRLHRADALFRDETNIEPPAAKRACLPETYVASGGSNSPPPSPAVASTALGKNDSTVGGCDIDVHPATERAIKPLFVTAGLGRGVDVSADGIARANALWIDQANNDKIEGSRVSFPDQRKMSPTVPTDIRSSVPTNGSSFQGFSTAGKGRTVTITEKSLAQANALLGNALWIDQANNDKIEGLGVSFPNQRNMSSTVSTDERSSVPTIGSSFQGFFTAGKGRTVTVTEETLARASAFLGEQYENFETPAPTQCLSRVSESDSKRPGLLPSSDSTYDKKRSGPVTSTGPVAFATAGQRSVLSVTVESMARASALLEARKEEFQTPAPPRHSHLVSLLDASTDLLSVASSERTKTCIPANDGHWLPSPANELNRLPRFTTAGNRRVVTTSAESVARAISLLADDAVDFQTPAPPQRAPRVSFTDAKWPVSVPTTESHRDLSSRRSQTEDSTEVFGVAALAASCRGQFNSGTSNVTLRAKFCSRDPLETFDTPIAPIRATRVSFVDSGKRVPSRTSFESLVGPRDPKTEGSFNDDDLPEIAAPEEKQVHTTSLDGAEHARALRSEFFSANDACEILRENETETTGSRFASSVMPSASGNQGCNEEDATFFTGHSKDSFESVVSRVTSVNAASVRFDVSSKLPCHIVRHNEAFSNVVGALPDYRAALGDLGVDASMIEDKWILNHVRWIVWKLASLERQFRRQEHGSSLTFDAVVKRLKARYNREFLKGERSPLRKVLNRDVSSLTMMILCVARVVLSEQETRDSLAVELTDGWYSVRASTDIPLRDFVSRGTIKVGSKLLVSNSALVGCEDGVDPLDASFDAMNEDSSPTLCISANGSRLAKWDSKLGFVRPSMVLKEAGGLLQIGKISDVLESGGRIPLIELIVLRKYPLLYRGTNRNGSPSRAADSESRYRIYTEQENEERIRCRENKREKFVEGIVDEVEAECMKVRCWSVVQVPCFCLAHFVAVVG